MAITFSYTFVDQNDFTPVTNDVANPAMAALSNGGIVVVADNGVNDSRGQYLNSALVQTGSTLGLTGTSPAAAQLTNGNVVIATQDADSIVYRVQNTAGGVVVPFTDIGDASSTNADVAALQNTGFVIVSQDNFGATDNDIDVRFYNSAGTEQFSRTVDGSGADDRNAAVAVLDNGNVVVTYMRTIGASTDVRAIIYDAAGNVVVSDFLVDSFGSINANPQVVATTAGFAIFYEDNGWGTGGTDITMARYTSGGVFQNFTNVSNPGNPASTRNETNVQVTRLADGNLAIAYEFDFSAIDRDVALRVLRDDGSAISSFEFIDGASSTSANQNRPDLAMLGQSSVAVAVDGSDTGIEIETNVVRVRQTSDGAADIMVAGQMFDDFFGGADDLVSYANSNAAVTVNLQANTASGGFATGDTLTGIDSLFGSDFGDTLTGNGNANLLKGLGGNDTLTGGAGTDTLLGDDGSDTLLGGDGVDRLDGGAGADIMEGGLGSDFYFVDNVNDVIQGEIGFASGGGIDTIFTTVDYTAPTNVEFIRQQAGAGNLTAIGNDAPGTIVGNEGNNRLEGRGGNDQINGNNGDDTLVGGEGRDTLVGGNGEDTFVYNSVSNSRAGAVNRDVINGFTRGGVQDIIDLSAVDANNLVAGNQAFAFLGNAAFDGFGSISAGQLRVQTLGGPNACIVEADVNGDGVADLQIFVNLTTFMTASDFIL